ncbi:MAG: LacI family transcriptional regulator [Lachnospiraceae bacterium]|nr:LacI family transcriptional regulator [Lachnospiraceae bacterium]
MSIKKIAEKVGVSPATVSRVLNNPKYKCKSKELRDKIWDTAIQMNYSPNSAARNLKLGNDTSDERTFNINVLMTRIGSEQNDPFFSELLRVVESEIYSRGNALTRIWYMPVFSDEKALRRVNLQRLVNETFEEAEGKADGLVIIGKCMPQALKIWRQKYKCIVSVNRNSTNYEVDEVLCDGKKVASLAVKHLVELGHKNIGYVGACHNESRYKGFQDVLWENGLDLVPDYIVESGQTEDDGYNAMKEFLSMDNPPTGIYCANDIIAVGMFKCMKKYKKLKYFPSIIASDDIPQAQNTNPLLTTVKLPCDEMGSFAIKLLMDRLNKGHESVSRIELEGKLIIRDSCKKL